jgi:hypothetical protein
VTLSGAASATATTDGSGNYSFTGLANGSYTVMPTKAGYTFSPASAPVTVSGGSVTGTNFSARYTISGVVTRTGGVTMNLTGGAIATTTTGVGGAYSFGGLAPGSYTVTPSKTGWTFTPAATTLTVSTNVTGASFVANTSSWDLMTWNQDPWGP